jgi:hypothetical protein
MLSDILFSFSGWLLEPHRDQELRDKKNAAQNASGSRAVLHTLLRCPDVKRLPLGKPSGASCALRSQSARKTINMSN